jgi:hypothetical protein
MPTHYELTMEMSIDFAMLNYGLIQIAQLHQNQEKLLEEVNRCTGRRKAHGEPSLIQQSRPYARLRVVGAVDCEVHRFWWRCWEQVKNSLAPWPGGSTAFWDRMSMES